MYDKRDVDDLKDPNLAVYQFRGYTVLKFNKAEKTLKFGDDANQCKFVDDDYSAMARFLMQCLAYRVGVAEDVKNTIVN